jgi:hypothetical protein
MTIYWLALVAAISKCQVQVTAMQAAMSDGDPLLDKRADLLAAEIVEKLNKVEEKV